MIFPFVWMISTSLKELKEIFRFPYSLFPLAPTITNFFKVWELVPFGRFYLNSIIMSGAITLSQLITCSLAAYAFARLRFLGREVLFYMFLSTMMIPQQVTMIPVYAILNFFGWIDTYAALIVPFAASAFGTFLLRQFFKTIPKELEDAAKLDGCGHLRFLWNIVLPLSRPALATLSIFTFMLSWNNYIWPLVVTNSEEMRTLQLGLATFRDEGGINWGYFMAATLMATVPVLIVFLTAQRQFVRGITLTGLKG